MYLNLKIYDISICKFFPLLYFHYYLWWEICSQDIRNILVRNHETLVGELIFQRNLLILFFEYFPQILIILPEERNAWINIQERKIYVKQCDFIIVQKYKPETLNFHVQFFLKLFNGSVFSNNFKSDDNLPYKYCLIHPQGKNHRFSYSIASGAHNAHIKH